VRASLEIARASLADGKRIDAAIADAFIEDTPAWPHPSMHHTHARMPSNRCTVEGTHASSSMRAATSTARALPSMASSRKVVRAQNPHEQGKHEQNARTKRTNKTHEQKRTNKNARTKTHEQ